MRWNANSTSSHFARGGTSGGTQNLYIEGDTIYSYGRHFPIARRLSPEEQSKTGLKYVFNKYGYSNTTAKHKSHVRCAIRDYIELPNCDMSEAGIAKTLADLEESLACERERMGRFKSRGPRFKSCQEEIKSLEKEISKYTHLLQNLYGGTAVLLIRDLAA